MESPKKKKLLFVITKSNFGGAQRYVYDLARSLKGRYEVVVACGGEGLMKERLEAAGVRTVSIPHLGRDVSLFKDGYSFFWLASFMDRERPDIVHLNSSKIGAEGALAAWLNRFGSLFGRRDRRFRTTTVFTAHAWAFNEDRSSLSKAAIAFLHWATVFLCDRTIAVSGAVKRQAGRFPFVQGKIQVVHLGLDPFEPLSRSEARAALGVPEAPFAIGSIAELHPVKGLSYALDAVRELPFDCTYTVIGEGDQRKALEATIAGDPILKSRATLKGFVKDASRYASAFDAFLLPSLSEAFGYVIVEAGYSKVPVVATSVGGIPEIIEDMKSGILIHSQNTKEISRALTFLKENPDTARALGAALDEKVRSQFSLEKMVEGTVRIYEGAIEK